MAFGFFLFIFIWLSGFTEFRESFSSINYRPKLFAHPGKVKGGFDYCTGGWALVEATLRARSAFNLEFGTWNLEL